MRDTREILRQKWQLGRTHRAIAASVGVSAGVVGLAVKRAADATLTWAVVEQMDDEDLERRLYPSVLAASQRPEPDCTWNHRERHRVGVTLELLHCEYIEQYPDGLRYLDHHLYSVPHRYVHHEVEARMTATTVEILLQRRVIAVHARSYVQGGFTTITEHVPSAHRAHAEWTPSRILTWAGKVGTSTHDLCSVILHSRPHPEQGFRSCLGIRRLAKRYGDARLEAARARALRPARARIGTLIRFSSTASIACS